MSGTAPAWTRPVEGYRLVPTLCGETIQQFAVRTTGDASNWTDIVALNVLVPPYLVDDAVLVVPGVALAGSDALRIEAAPPAAGGTTDAGDIFGTDWAMSDDFAVGPTGDFLTVSDLANLRQAIETKLRVHTLDLIWHPTFGCDLYKLLGGAANGANDQLAAAYAARAIGADPRVSSVANLTATITGDTCAIAGVAVAVDGRRLPGGSALSTTSPVVGLASTVAATWDQSNWDAATWTV